MSEWLAAFRGIDYIGRRGADLYAMGDMAEMLAPRLRNRLASESVRVPIATLSAVAARIDAQSRRIAALEGAGPALGPDDLAAYEAAQEALAERAAVKAGNYVSDPDTGEAALYGRDGEMVWTADAAIVMDAVRRDDWIVTTFEARGLVAAEGGFPDTLPEFQAAYGRLLRARRAAEVAAARADG